MKPDSIFLSICHYEPEVTPADKIRCDVCVVVEDGFATEGEVGVIKVFGGEYAVYTHHGSHSKLMDSYIALCGQWAPQSGREIKSEPSIEHYLNSPHDTPEDELITDSHIPIK